MGFPSLREDIEEAMRLASLTSSSLGALALSEATAAEVGRQEQVVNGLLKRCVYMAETLQDIRKSASEVGSDVGNHAYFVRASLERANENIAALMERVTELEARLRMKLTAPRKKKEARASKKTVRRVAQSPKRTPQQDAINKTTVREKKRHVPRQSEVVGTVSQSFSHGRKKSVIVEKIVSRSRMNKD